MDNQKILQNNKGLSLIEIIIVLAIMSIIGGAFLLTTAVATDKHVSSCGEKMLSSLEQTRNLAMGKQTGYIEISKPSASDSVYIQMYLDGYGAGHEYGDRVAIGHQGLTVEYLVEGASDYASLSGGTITLEFSRSNGSLITTPAIKKIRITNGRRTYIITIDKFTGRVSGEKS